VGNLLLKSFYAGKIQMKSRPLSPSFIVFCLLCIFFIISFLSALLLSATYDEARNYDYGKSIISGDSNRPGDISILDGTRIDGSTMAASALNAIPFKIASFLGDSGFSMVLSSIITARMVTIIFSVLAALLIFRWSRELYGFAAALFSLLLYIFDPNIIAHSQLVTTDLYAWGTTLLVFYCSWKFAKERTWKNGLIWALALGISSLAKYTTVILIPLSMLSIFIYDLPQFIHNYKDRPAASIKNMVQKIPRVFRAFRGSFHLVDQHRIFIQPLFYAFRRI
jgi:hypothetical protein